MCTFLPFLPGNVRVAVCAGDLLPVRAADPLPGRACLEAAVLAAVVAVVGEEGQPHPGLAQQLLHVLSQVVHEPVDGWGRSLEIIRYPL